MNKIKRTKQRVRHFHLERRVDETGMSGVGRVAEGVQLPNGVTVMWWLVPEYCVSIYRSVEELHKIHKHDDRGTTDLIWED